MIRHYFSKKILYALIFAAAHTVLKAEDAPKSAEPNGAQEWCPKMEYKEPTFGHYLRHFNSVGLGASLTRVVFARSKYKLGALGDSALNIASAYCEYNKVNNTLLGVTSLTRAIWLLKCTMHPSISAYTFGYSLSQGSLSLTNAGYRLFWAPSKK